VKVTARVSIPGDLTLSLANRTVSKVSSGKDVPVDDGMNIRQSRANQSSTCLQIKRMCSYKEGEVRFPLPSSQVCVDRRLPFYDYNIKRGGTRIDFYTDV
jgi:hypothetical protein